MEISLLLKGVEKQLAVWFDFVHYLVVIVRVIGDSEDFQMTYLPVASCNSSSRF